MKTALIASPYDLGREGEGMALGPARYLEAGVNRSLSKQGFEVEVETIERRRPFVDELRAVSDINAVVAEHVQDATERGDFPLVLGGNCDTAIGVMAGLEPSRVGVIWFDAHGDFGTPETTPGGYLGSMPLSIITGHCHGQILKSTGNDTTVPEKNVVMVDVRNAEPEQRLRLENSAIQVIASDEIASSLHNALSDLSSRVDEIYLHIDIDSLDPRYAPGVDFPAPDGLSVEDVETAVGMAARIFRIRAATLTAYNPDKDEDGKTLRAGTRLIGAVAEAAAGSKEMRHGR